jgi:4-amino-4-deoxy-L-arabinose transferase-like glycosyltransferase
MTEDLHRERAASGKDIFLLALVGVALFFPFLGKRDLWTSGEARVAQVARQMLQADDGEVRRRLTQKTTGKAEETRDIVLRGKWQQWIIPAIGDDLRLKKPPLAYWLAAVSGIPSGDVDEFASRVPNALAAVGVMLLVYLLGCSLFGRLTGLFSALALATTGVFWWQARTTGIEMPLLFFNMLSLYGWWRYRNDGGERKVFWLLMAYAALGLSILEKGPVGPLLVLLIIFAYLPVSERWGEPGTKVWHHLAGLAVMLAVALPWPLLVLRELPVAWDVWFRESGGRFAGFDHIKNVDYFVLKILGDGQPWVFFALLASLLLWRSDEREKEAYPRNMVLFPLVWALVTLVFFSIPASKKSYYILPIYPALALLAGMFFSALCRQDVFDKVRKLAGRIVKIMGGFVLFAAVVFGVALALEGSGAVKVSELISSRSQVSEAYAGHWPQFYLGGLTAFALGVALLRFAKRNNYGKVFAAICCATAIVFAVEVSMLDDLNRHKADKILCSYLPPLEQEDKVFTYSLSGVPIMMYYTNHHVERLGNEEHILRFLDTGSTGTPYFMVKRDDYERLGCSFVVRIKADAGGKLLPNGEILKTMDECARRIGADSRLIQLKKSRTNLLPERRTPYLQDGQGMVASARWLLVRVEIKKPNASGKLKTVWDADAARACLEKVLTGLPCSLVSVRELLPRVEHEPVENGAMWARGITSGRKYITISPR